MSTGRVELFRFCYPNK